jgi:hypothetical protein
MQAFERASWQNPKVLTTLLLVFIVGAFTGALSMRLGLHERLHPAAPSSWKDPHMAKVFLDRCRKELNLTPKQAEEMGSILDDYKLYYQSVQDELDEVRSTGKGRIMALLDEHQRQQFEKMLNELPK